MQKRLCKRRIRLTTAGISVGLVGLVILFVTVSAPKALGANTVLDTEGFESPLNTLGTIVGQPAELNNGASTQNWLTFGGGSGTAVVQNSIFAPGGGSQALRVDRAANSDDRWAVFPLTGVPGAGTPFVYVEWDMYVPTQNIPSGFGPAIGVEGYDDSGSIALLGSLLIDVATQDILYQATGTGFLVETGTSFSYDQWHRYRILFDFGSAVYSVFFDGNPLVENIGFVDGASFTSLTDADIAALAGAGDPTSQALTGTAYIDNFSIGQIPEPTGTVFVLAAFFGGVWWRRRRVW
ncbi:MAG: hypothetical protein AAGD22_00835 [Verrucomicrobiota bacterium]